MGSVTERERTARRRRSPSRTPGEGLAVALGDLLGALEDPWVCLDHRSGRVGSCNEAFAGLLGTPAGRLRGRTLRFRESGRGSPAALAGDEPFTATIVSPAGEPLEVHVEAVPLAFPGEEPVALALRVVPVGQEASWSVAALRDRIERLEELLTRLGRELEQLGLTRLASPTAALDDATRRQLASLTGRERQVLDALLGGRRVQGIARDLAISPNTVRNHLKGIFRKLGVGSQTDLLVKLRPLRDGQTG
ncbi:MAG: helix-turn-helix transcriptional regulator [Acidimicrobiia bacterium]|nr:helix-turn-helix transcriptional regulator [Acidimicrobiia bacterium]